MKTNKKKTKSVRKTRKQTPTKIYDYIILGGGIAGLHTIYKLSKLYPNKTMLLLEKTNRFGGRVESVQLHPTNDPGYIIEAGAGRFSQHHPNLQALIKEFGLASKIVSASATPKYYPIRDETEHKSKEIENQNQKQNQEKEENESIFSQTTNLIQELIIGDSKLEKLVLNIILSSKLQSREYLQKRNFTSYAKTVVSKDEIEFILGAFGYYSELVIMNAYDAIQLMQQLSPTNTFYTLSGGLSQIIDSLVERTQTTLKLHQEVVSILPNKHTNTYRIQTKTNRFLARTVIGALPKQALEKLSIFQPIRKTLLSKIHCGKLCRIYARFHPNEEIWFKDLPKITTNNNLRMVIPINVKKGLIMISYSDNKYADFWYRLYQKGKKPLIEELRKEIRQTTGKIIPEPMEIHVFYWSCGVGYWGIGANSEEISQKMIQPLTKHPNIYCCGEHFSEKNQQWMEGALETSQKVIDKISDNSK